MSRSIEVSDEVYGRIETIASARGTTPTRVVEELVRIDLATVASSVLESRIAPSDPGPERNAPRTLADLIEGLIGVVPNRNDAANPSDPPLALDERAEGKPSRSMADLMKGLVGTFDSGGLDAIAARPGDAYSDYLLEKKRQGRL